MTSVVDNLVHHKLRSRWLLYGLLVLIVFTVILLGAMFGLTWAVILSLKDTKVSVSKTTIRGVSRAEA